MKVRIRKGGREFNWNVPEGYEDFVNWMLQKGYKPNSVRTVVAYLRKAIENPKLADEHYSKYVRTKIRQAMRKWNEYLQEVGRCRKYLD